jgi:hypothetical protein
MFWATQLVRLLLAQSSRSLSSIHERWRRPDAAPSTKGWAKGAMSQSEESTDTGATGDPTNDRTQKTGPMCISRRLLKPCAHGAGLIVAAFSARNILRCVKLTSDGGRDTAAALACGKTARLLLHLLGDFLGRLGSLLCFLRFFCHVFLVGLVGLTNVRTLRTSARHQANTKLAKTIPR